MLPTPIPSKPRSSMTLNLAILLALIFGMFRLLNHVDIEDAWPLVLLSLLCIL